MTLMKELVLPYQTLTAVPFTNVSIEDRFWSNRIKATQKSTIAACLAQCEATGRISNFAKAGGLQEGGFEGIFYNDSDVYKVLEGIAYSLLIEPDEEMEAQADRIIELIAAAQQEDGYLQTYFTLAEPDKKWTDMNKHEEYCAGHMIEAAIAYKQATGKRLFLDAAIRVADHIDSLFGPGKRHWVPGHQEIEVALVKLYVETGEERYWKLAYWLLEERGHGHGVGYSWDRSDWGAAYSQDDVPVRDICGVTGHAVRAMYMYAGMTDAAMLSGDQGYIDALDRVWSNVVDRNMYITGGIGPSRHNEGFTEDYDLPNDSAYCETCASVGMVLWNHRMNLLHGDSKYADIVERAMFNGSIAGVSLSGDKFFYVNPLESDGTHHRVPWYNCSCCPTQIARFIPSIGNYVYATRGNDIVVNQYVDGTGRLRLQAGEIVLRQVTEYPWDGRITLRVEEGEAGEFGIQLRIPSWCMSYRLSVGDMEIADVETVKGYVRLQRAWKPGDEITLELTMQVERVYSHPLVLANAGKVALQRGPLVYCLEETDNAASYDGLSVNSATRFRTVYEPDILQGVISVFGEEPGGEQPFKAIPYYAWDNRDAGKMKVWLPEKRNETKLYRS
ncbi:glycoside hydrolase family 127 protein [Paenibacillus montanisoli]|uniref:Glycoside hydrolase family 127 protein n=1 Tax=Paenibacillus montanisoli TaxID=2081970 RepID=A0A328U6I3_9BACL|nr:beta-L-arabinofuranosidase domain-containing protein [Paenibacillus montanisoli]RAP77373.1 glycoside hydrolase family 127 protein [Paenibacillus montanisoli]